LIGISLTFLLTGTIIGISISMMENNYKTLMLINQNLLERTECINSVTSLTTEFTGKLKKEERKSLDQPKNIIKRCLGCHKNKPVVVEIRKLQSQLHNLLRLNLSRNSPVKMSNINTDRIDSLYNTIFTIKDFAENSFYSVNSQLQGYFLNLKNNMQVTKRLFIFSMLLSIFSIIALSIIVRKRITEIQKDNEEKSRVIQEWANQWQQIFDSMADMVAIVDEKCSIVSANQAMLRTFKDSIIGKDICSILKVSCSMKNEAEPFAHEVSRLLHFNSRVYSFKAYPLTSRKRGHILVLRDITKEYELERRTMQAEQLAALGQLTACIAHEIRNPLTGIVGYAEILMSHQLDSITSEYIKKIYNSANRINAVVEDMLFYAKSSRLRKVSVDLNEVINEAIDELSDCFNTERVNFIKNYSNLPQLSLDRELIKIVISNILCNAVQAILTSGTGDTISINTSKGRDFIRITIRDNGPGIKEENLNKIFDPFFTTNTTDKCTGLGMWMTYNFVKAHQGDICVNSKPTQGTVFDIRLPLKEMPDIQQYDKG
ncbi:MAG: PAS domain-containing protein, partial [Nitrospirae bacterium]|nr:PAS domain-containing protein [Nitrospirota bacterium]